MVQAKPGRPTGVTVLAVLSILSGVALLSVAGVGTLGSTSLVVSYAFGIVLLVLGLIYLIVAVGFFTAKPWSWPLALVAFGIGIILTLLMIAISPTANLIGNIIGLIFAFIIVFYLFRPNVKAYFGRAGASTTGTTLPPTATTS